MSKIIAIKAVKYIKGRLIKSLGGNFWVQLDGGEVVRCQARGLFRIREGIVPGDFVILAPDRGGYVIERILPRKNQLVRPFIANIDQIIIVLAQRPVPDLLLVDKLIISCLNKNIIPAVCINKSDENAQGFAEEIFDAYKNVCAVLSVSATTCENIDKLCKLCSGKFSTFAGQSAVGKSSLINAIAGTDERTGELSSRVSRGRHTTRHTEIFSLGTFDTLVADTPGFSILRAENLEPAQLGGLYPDFARISSKCRFNDCVHVNEPGCAIKAAAKSGKINDGRYGRYLKIFEEIKDKKDKDYE